MVMVIETPSGHRGLAALSLTALLVVGGLLAGPKVPSALDTATSTTPIAIYCNRTVANEAKYTEDWTAFSNYVFEGTPGVKAIFSFMDKTTSGYALQFFWFNNVGAFYGQPKDKPELSAALWSNYDPASTTDVCQVWGGWTPAMKAIAATLPGVHYEFVPTLAGFMRSSGGGLESKPLFFVSRRKVQPGHMTTYGETMQAVADWWFANTKGLLAGLCYTSEEDENAVWDLRVMANWMDGFVAHVKPAVFPLIFPWSSNLDKAVPFMDAVAFSSSGEPEAMVAANPGNGQYTHYVFEEGMLGPMPDFNKGD